MAATVAGAGVALWNHVWDTLTSFSGGGERALEGGARLFRLLRAPLLSLGLSFARRLPLAPGLTLCDSHMQPHTAHGH
jgi:hypothetical protein